jgi:hypothetical protein
MSKSLPKLCYAPHPVDGSVVMIRYGESGYHPQPGMTDFDRRESNGVLGLTEEDERMMMAGSMFGWDAPAVVAHFR